jgi:hypothetical protein
LRQKHLPYSSENLEINTLHSFQKIYYCSEVGFTSKFAFLNFEIKEYQESKTSLISA